MTLDQFVAAAFVLVIAALLWQCLPTDLPRIGKEVARTAFGLGFVIMMLKVFGFN